MKITDDLISTVSAQVQMGIPPLVACMAEGATEADFAEWWAKGSAGGRSKAVELHDAILKAEAQAEAILVGKVRTAAGSNWQAAAWLAERRFPERYVRRSVSKGEDGAGQDPATGPPDRFAALDNVTPLRR